MAFTIGEVGGIVGLISAVFVFYDRFYKGRPVVSLTVRADGDRTKVCIRIKNTTPYDVAIIGNKVTRGWFFRPSKVYFLAETSETIDLVRAQLGSQPQFMLQPEEEKLLQIYSSFDGNVPLEVSQPGRIDFLIQWRRGNATWLVQPPLPVCTSTEAIRLYSLRKPI